MVSIGREKKKELDVYVCLYVQKPLEQKCVHAHGAVSLQRVCNDHRRYTIPTLAFGRASSKASGFIAGSCVRLINNEYKNPFCWFFLSDA